MKIALQPVLIPYFCALKSYLVLGLGLVLGLVLCWPSWSFADANQTPMSQSQPSIKVMSLNAQNYFNGRISRGNISFHHSRGPKTSSQYQAKKRSLIRLIKAAEPDIIALQEIENDTRFPKPAILDLLRELNQFDASWRLTKVPTGQKKAYGSDAITQFILFKENDVFGAVGEGKFIPWTRNGSGRPLVLQKFKTKTHDALDFCIANSHLKSRRNTCRGDRNCVHKRVKQAQKFQQELQKQRKTCPNILWVGDFNAEPSHKTMQYLKRKRWQLLLPDSSYSYVFRGKKILLDHALWQGVSSRFKPVAKIVHTPAVQSDHRPILVELKLEDMFIQ